ncbi:MAG: NADH-quinone oxidoreductase subunit J [Deltaproteobacteria bacterium]|nr:MAG: NADH-quinone oxidoreductase subunit J [Deltaproteobacteria bacterium]
MEVLFFYLVALVAVLSGLIVVTAKSPVNSALALVNTFFCLAVFYVMLHAPFMAAIQIMVYAGAIMVLILFVIMLLNMGVEPHKKPTHIAWGAIGGTLVLLVSILFIQRGDTARAVGNISKDVVLREGHTALIGKAMFVDFLLPFEIASILLLVAIVGAVILAKKEV